MANVVYKVVKPPVVPKALPSTSSHEVPSASNQPEDGGPEPVVSEPKESTPSTPKPSQQVQERVTEASNTDSDKADEPTPEEEQPPQGPKVKIPLRLLKHGSKAMTSSSKDGATPSKVQKELEANETEATASTGPSEAALWKARFELYKKNLPEVKEVCAQILSLEEGEKATQEDFDSSPDFRLRRAIDETHLPTVIGEHWIDHLDNEGRIAKCKPHDFKFDDEWLPLYTRAGVTKQVSGLDSLLNTQGDSPLIAIIPLDMSFQYEQEYVIHQLHEAECLARVSVYYGESQQKQIAFCPYCGIMNENSATAYSHAIMNELCSKILKDVKQANPLKWVIHVNSASKVVDELFYWKDQMKQDIDCMILHIQTKLYNGLDELYGEMYNLFLEEDEEAA